MATSLSNPVNNLTEGVYGIKYSSGYDNKKCKTCEIKYKDCECCLEYTNVTCDFTVYKCLCCNRNYQKEFVEHLKRRFADTYTVCNHDVNKFKFI